MEKGASRNHSQVYVYEQKSINPCLHTHSLVCTMTRACKDAEGGRDVEPSLVLVAGALASSLSEVYGGEFYLAKAQADDNLWRLSVGTC